MHQTVIGEEALLQLAQVGETPDLLVGCTGGGSNFGGLAFPFLREKWAGRMSPTIRAVEPASCPSLTQGTYAYDFGDTLGMTPLMKMHTLGHDFMPDPIHAGGLRYHGMSPLISPPVRDRRARGGGEEAVGVLRGRGALRPHRGDRARARADPRARRDGRGGTALQGAGEEKVILTALCGHGHLDLAAYDAYLRGDLVDHSWDDAELQQAVADALEKLPAVAG